MEPWKQRQIQDTIIYLIKIAAILICIDGADGADGQKIVIQQ